MTERSPTEIIHGIIEEQEERELILMIEEQKERELILMIEEQEERELILMIEEQRERQRKQESTQPDSVSAENQADVP
ncbi:TPA: hypothetical protein ACV7C8_000652 [Escherichia coli]|uniref:hypothetical protein n=1 Tax=Escherichia coli TaxID=562 RepID=UPI00226463DD|nr:hypothetical protein [Escherichia coli]MCX8446937.1 hypothetical protein [Escherichia coli]HDJ0015025.1 hypothetical protein [Escherichia coli]